MWDLEKFRGNHVNSSPEGINQWGEGSQGRRGEYEIRLSNKRICQMMEENLTNLEFVSLYTLKKTNWLLLLLLFHFEVVTADLPDSS